MTTQTKLTNDQHLWWMTLLAEVSWQIREIPIAELIHHPGTSDTGREMLLGLSLAHSAIADQFGPSASPTAVQP